MKDYWKFIKRTARYGTRRQKSFVHRCMRNQYCAYDIYLALKMGAAKPLRLSEGCPARTLDVTFGVI